MNEKAIELLEKAIKRLKQYQEPPVIRIGKHPLKVVYDNLIQALALLKQQPPAEAINADLRDACEFTKAQIKKGSQKKALPILRAAISKYQSSTSVEPSKNEESMQR